MKVTKITEWSLDNQVDIGDDTQEWINCAFYYLHEERQVRALLTYHSTHPSHNACNLSGIYDNGQLAKVYHRQTSNVIDRIFVSNSLIANPRKSSWLYECVPLKDISHVVLPSEIEAGEFTASPYMGYVMKVVIPDSVAQKVYDFINQ